MRRTIVLFPILLAATAAQAEPQTPRGEVLAYECEQIDPAETGFSCTFENGRINIQLHEKQDDMSKEKRKRSNYEFNKIALRYFEFGGSTFPVHADFWAANQYRGCGHAARQPWYVFICWDSKTD